MQKIKLNILLLVAFIVVSANLFAQLIITGNP